MNGEFPKDGKAPVDGTHSLLLLDASIERSLADVHAKRVTDGAEVFDRLHAKYALMAKVRH
jgi:hypothetical protein